MSFKSDFSGREIDAQIKYIKESLPTIIEGIVKNIEALSKNKAEKSTVPSKTSQITNDSGYITDKALKEELSTTAENIINTLKTEHVEHISGDEIDTKYKVGDDIPALMIYEHDMYTVDYGYESEDIHYENAPFELDGIIITHSCMFDNGDGTTSPFAYQFAISYDGIIKHRTCADEEFADVPWSGNLVPEKLSQLENDTEFVKKADIIGEQLFYDEIDTKYYPGDANIPFVISYDFRSKDYPEESYNNAPFPFCTIITMHQECFYDDMESINYTSYQIATDGNEIKVRRASADGEGTFEGASWIDVTPPKKISQLEDDIGFKDVKDMYDTLMDAGYDAEMIVSAVESAFEGCQIANRNVERIESVETNLNAGALKGSVSDSFVSLDDVSPIPHKVKANVHSKNLFNINDVYKSTYMDYRIEDNKLIFKKTNTGANQFTNIFFDLGTCKDFENKTLTISMTNEFSKALSTHLVYRVEDVLYTSEPLVRLGTVKANDTTTFTVTVPKNDIDGIMCLRIVSSDTTVNDDEYTLSNIQVEYGTQATEYKPFVNIEDATITSCGANLFDVHNAEYIASKTYAEVSSDGTLKVASAVNGSYQNAKFTVFNPKKPETIYFSFKARKGTEKTVPTVRIRYESSITGESATIYTTPTLTDEWTQYAYKLPIAESRLETYDTIVIQAYSNNSSTPMSKDEAYIELKDIMISKTDEAYKPYQGAEYTPDASGNVDIASISPDMSIYSDNGVMINAEYNRDINKAFAELQAMILGG